MRRDERRAPLAVSGGVLVVDADRDSRLVVDLRSGLAGHDVASAHDVGTALTLAREQRPALVLIRDGGGLAVRRLCGMLRADWRFGNPVLFVITPEGRRSALLEGVADECLPPMDAQVLARRIDAALQRSAAMRDASPLTGLPGNAAITAEVKRRLAQRQPFALLHVDLDNFKVVNDRYGFLRGDDMIVALAGVLRSATGPDAFVGHVGGDDFVVLTAPDDAEAVAQRIIDDFEAVVPELYDDADLARGGLEVVDRQGVRRAYGLATISVGVAFSRAEPGEDHRALAAVAADMKAQAKAVAGSALAVDRRSRSGGPGRLPSSRRRAGRRLVRRLAAPKPLYGAGLTRRRAITTLAVALLLAVTAMTGFSAAAAPGDRLYPTKLLLEQARLLVATDPAAEVELHLTFASRRLHELDELIARQAEPELVEQATRHLREHLAAVERHLAAGAEPERIDRAQLQRYGRTLAQQQRLLDMIVAQECSREAAWAALRACDDLRVALASVGDNLTVVRGELPAAPSERDAPDGAPGARGVEDEREGPVQDRGPAERRRDPVRAAPDAVERGTLAAPRGPQRPLAPRGPGSAAPGAEREPPGRPEERPRPQPSPREPGPPPDRGPGQRPDPGPPDDRGSGGRPDPGPPDDRGSGGRPDPGPPDDRGPGNRPEPPSERGPGDRPEPPSERGPGERPDRGPGDPPRGPEERRPGEPPAPDPDDRRPDRDEGPDPPPPDEPRVAPEAPGDPDAEPDAPPERPDAAPGDEGGTAEPPPRQSRPRRLTRTAARPGRPPWPTGHARRAT